jgi:hypothetical protein
MIQMFLCPQTPGGGSAALASPRDCGINFAVI